MAAHDLDDPRESPAFGAEPEAPDLDSSHYGGPSPSPRPDPSIPEPGSSAVDPLAVESVGESLSGTRHGAVSETFERISHEPVAIVLAAAAVGYFIAYLAHARR